LVVAKVARPVAQVLVKHQMGLMEGVKAERLMLEMVMWQAVERVVLMLEMVMWQAVLMLKVVAPVVQMVRVKVAPVVQMLRLKVARGLPLVGVALLGVRVIPTQPPSKKINAHPIA
jgi:hypothetical protein